MEVWIGLGIGSLCIAFGGLLTWAIGKVQQSHLVRELRDVLHDRQHVSLNEEFLMAQILAKKIRKADSLPDVIFAVSPGGLMIGEWLSLSSWELTLMQSRCTPFI